MRPTYWRVAGAASAFFCVAFASTSPSLAKTPLRVCADPNNLPFSNAAGEGFENKIIALVAERLDRPLQMVWRAQRRGFLREGLNAGECDLVAGVPLGIQGVRTTRPYYRSSYVFVSRPGEAVVPSLEDLPLAKEIVGVQLIGDDMRNSPPAEILSLHGFVRNVRGYPVYGDYRQAAPMRRIIDAVANREIDIAAVWGPTAGFFANMQKPSLTVTRILQPDDTTLPLAFDIAMGVRQQDASFAADVNQALSELKPRIEMTLSSFHVPVISSD